MIKCTKEREDEGNCVAVVFAEGEREGWRTGIIVSQALIDRREGMSEGWRGNTGCANEHDIPTLSPIETIKEYIRNELSGLCSYKKERNPTLCDTHVIVIPVQVSGADRVGVSFVKF